MGAVFHLVDKLHWVAMSRMEAGEEGYSYGYTQQEMPHSEFASRPPPIGSPSRPHWVGTISGNVRLKQKDVSVHQVWEGSALR